MGVFSLTHRTELAIDVPVSLSSLFGKVNKICALQKMECDAHRGT